MAMQEINDLLLRLRAMPSSLNDALRMMDEAADCIEALEAALRAIQKATLGGQSMDEAAADNFGLTADDLDEEDDEDAGSNTKERAAARIEALEAALREIEWHDPKSPAAAAVRAVLDRDAEELGWEELCRRQAARIEALEAALRTIRDDGRNCVDHCRRQADKALRISACDALDKDTEK